MSEARRIYRLSRLDLNELNRVLSQLADRLDQIEGFRGTPDFLTSPTSRQNATASDELVVRSQLGGLEGEVGLNTDSIAALAASTEAALALKRGIASGEMFIDSDQVITLTDASTDYQITGFTLGHVHQITGGTDTLILTAGHWLVFGHVSFSPSATGQDLMFGIGVGGVVDPQHVTTINTLSLTTEVVPVTGIIEVEDGQAVGIYVQNETSASKTITVHDATIIAAIIH